jgi:hypothetical protein
MPLDIREIFISDLDPNKTDFWSNDKVDKLNHNFRQLVLGGPQGPVGKTGFSGDPGARGPQGLIGHDGHQGFEGFQGPEGKEPWKLVDEGAKALTLLPKFNGVLEYTATAVNFGQSSSLNPQTSLSGSSLILHTDIQSNHNIELRSEDTLERAKIDINSYGSAASVDLGGKDTPGNFNLNYWVDEFNWKTPTSDVLSVSQNIFKVSKATVFELDVDVDTLSYNNGALDNYILVSDNSQGDTSFRYKYDLFDALPIGSIISIPYSEFNSSNFELDGTYYTVDGGLLNIVWGRGKAGTKFEGWYICNGQTWNVDGIVQYEVPNLNSFTYSIDPHVNQPAASGGNDTVVIIGGGEISMSATYSNSEYTTQMTVSTLDEDLNLNFITGGNHNLSKNVHITYLGINNMSWQSVITPTITETIDLLGPSISFEVACLDTTLTQFLWNGIGKTWTNLNEDLTGVKLYTTTNQIATGNRWYATGGVARYWTGNEFTSSIDCPVQQTIELLYDADVTELNGTVSNGQNFVINNVNFSAATTLMDQMGSAVAAGWYREVNGSSYSIRRYWDGTNFAGSTIDTEFVTYLGEVSGSIYFDSNACTNQLDNFKIYNSSNSTATSVDALNDAYNTSGKVMVHLDWHTGFIGESALAEVYLQNRPGASTPYRSLVDSSYRANIKIDSTLQQPVSC